MAKRAMATALVVLLLLASTPAVRAQAPPPPGSAPAGGAPDAIGVTPPRLSYSEGAVSFFRPGAQDWAPAQINTPLAPGDELYTGNDGNIELQIGGRAYVRGWGDTQVGLANQEPDFLQLKITTGHATVDVRSVDPGRTIEIDTPHAAFTVESAGYYRVDVAPDRTSFVTRRGGRAGMTPAGGQPVAIAASEEIVLEGVDSASVRSFAAPELDVWDRWNYARTDALIESTSARYVPPQVYGADDLDHYGSWRVVPTYGSIWVPQAVPAGWAPYSTGRWIFDPHYGWTWVDTAPWGWAPYHYGRWVSVDGYWAWAPGPVVARPVYAPALVAFFSAPGVTVSVGTPFVSWVALSWGEPLVPWWGRPGFVGRPYWGGWGGPRVVNNVVVHNTTVVNVTNVTVYRNTTVNNAVVAVRQDGFGRQGVHEARITRVDVRQLKPVHGALPVKPQPVSFVAGAGAASVRPPETAMARPVVATRPAAPRRVPEGGAPVAHAAVPVSVPAPKIVPTPKAVEKAPVPTRPPFGASDVERPRRAEPPRPETSPRPQVGTPAAGAPARPDPGARTEPAPGRREPTSGARIEGGRPELSPPAQAERERGRGGPEAAPPAAARPPQPQRQQPAPPAGKPPLPGEPADRLSPGRRRHPRASGTHTSRRREPRSGAPRRRRPRRARHRVAHLPSPCPAQRASSTAARPAPTTATGRSPTSPSPSSRWAVRERRSCSAWARWGHRACRRPHARPRSAASRDAPRARPGPCTPRRRSRRSDPARPAAR